MSSIDSKFDVVVVGAGHAGVEAASASARLGCRTALVTGELSKASFMSCNPSIGGLGKGHIVKEIDVFAGVMPTLADKACIQFKRLNSKKGPAVRGSRAQCDKAIYSAESLKTLKKVQNLELIEAEVKNLIVDGSECSGVILKSGEKVLAHSVVMATGTFMRGVMHIGLEKIEGGRVGEKATYGLSEQLADLGFEVARLKTGTPPRLEKDSIDWSKLATQFGDSRFIPFSYRSSRKLELEQIPTHLSFTNEKTHDIIRESLHLSPMFTGAIEGLGPRYCPSIEDKITRFSEKNKHQTFLEVEGLGSNSVYLQGISTSLPQEVQQKFLETIPGLESVKILRPGYAVEYDFFEPRQIFPTLETRELKGLFFAGQINGTSGYEEAAGQGLVAGINAALRFKNQSEFTLGRDESYIGVLIDDLVTKGTKEPYRMMTSRAEHRLYLREDNTLDRLFSKADSLGLLSEEEHKLMSGLLDQRSGLLESLEKNKISPTEETQAKLREMDTPVLTKQFKLKELLRRNEVSCLDLKTFGIDVPDDEFIYEPVEIAVKYEGYINRELELIEQTRKLERLKIPQNIVYKAVKGLSLEEVEKLELFKPLNVGQAKRISGVNPSAIKAIIVHIKGRKRGFGEMVSCQTEIQKQQKTQVQAGESKIGLRG